MSVTHSHHVSPSITPAPLRDQKPVRHYNDKDPLIRDLGLPFLAERGYINLHPVPTPDPGFGYVKHTVPAVTYRRHKKTRSGLDTRVPSLPVEEEYYVHPIFSREMWDVQELASHTSPHWNTLKPVWQLATLLLEEKLMSGFLCGMLDRSKYCDILLIQQSAMKHRAYFVFGSSLLQLLFTNSFILSTRLTMVSIASLSTATIVMRNSAGPLKTCSSIDPLSPPVATSLCPTG